MRNAAVGGEATSFLKLEEAEDTGKKVENVKAWALDIQCLFFYSTLNYPDFSKYDCFFQTFVLV